MLYVRKYVPTTNPKCNAAPVKEKTIKRFIYMPSKFFLSPPVVLFSFISRFALVRKQIVSNTTGPKKISGRDVEFHEKKRLIYRGYILCNMAVVR